MNINIYTRKKGKIEKRRKTIAAVVQYIYITISYEKIERQYKSII